MEKIMETLIQIIDSLGWPITILIIALIFKSELSKLLLKLSTLKYKDFEAKFGHQLEVVEKKVKELPKPKFKKAPPPEIEEKSKEEETDFDRLIRIAEISPRAAIAEAWTEVEIAARKAANQAKLKINKPESVINIANAFINEGVFNDAVLTALNEIRDLRNKAVHMEDFNISHNEAIKYIDLAFNLAFELYNVGNVFAWANEQDND
jgi:hypothetical protein